MPIELRPLGVKCNIACQYCYQNPQRDAGNVLHKFDVAKMKAAIEASRDSFTLFGGEPLLIPESVLEELWSWGLQKFGKNGIQTNGTLISESHIEMFKRFRVQVGMSLDGPGGLNDVRWAGTLESTRRATDHAHAALERLCREKIPVSLIVTLHRCNATRENLPQMHAWMHHVEAIGVKRARLHILEVEDEAVRRKYALTTSENLEAMLSFWELQQQLKTLKFDVFNDMFGMLLGRDRSATCIWGACDPYTTKAVQGIEGNGQQSNCGRTNKDGIDFTKSQSEGFERYLALYHTPQESGGCKDCRFFLMCKGQCPGTSIDGDWRNRTEHCEVWMQLYTHLESRLLEMGFAPLSLSSERTRVENLFLNTWAQGKNVKLASAMQQLGITLSKPVPQAAEAEVATA